MEPNDDDVVAWAYFVAYVTLRRVSIAEAYRLARQPLRLFEGDG